jgi:hypothetical protein
VGSAGELWPRKVVGAVFDTPAYGCLAMEGIEIVLHRWCEYVGSQGCGSANMEMQKSNTKSDKSSHFYSLQHQ